jgi:hypothetical protein
MKITEDVRKYAAKEVLTEAETLQCWKKCASSGATGTRIYSPV